MLAHRPNAFLVGVLIGSLLHLMVLPWLTGQPVRAQAGQVYPQTDPENYTELDGITYLVPDSASATALREMTRASHRLLGMPLPMVGDVVGMESSCIAALESLTNTNSVAAGDWYMGQFADGAGHQVPAEFLILQSIELDHKVAEKLLDDREYRAFQSSGLTYRVVWSIVDTVHGFAFLSLMTVSDTEGSIAVPIQVINADDAAAIAFGALTLEFESGAIGPEQLHALLLELEAYGVGIQPWMYPQKPSEVVSDHDPGDTVTTRQPGPPNQGATPVWLFQCALLPNVSEEARHAHAEWLDAAIANYRLCMQAANDQFKLCAINAIGAGVALGFIRIACAGGLAALSPSCLAALGIGLPAIGALLACEACHRSKVRQCLNWLQQNAVYLCTQANTGQVPSGLQNNNTVPSCL